MAIDHKNKISEEQYRRILQEEFKAMLREKFSQGTLDEGIMDKLTGGASKIGNAYVKLFNSYADVLKSVYGQEPPPDVPTPDEMGKELAQGDEEGADAELNDFQKAIQDLAKDPKIDAAAEDIVSQIMGKAQKVDDKLGGDGEEAQQKTPDSDNLLNLLDKVMDEWDVVQNKTKDKNLKKSMDYIEKVAVAEQKEKSQNG